MINRRVVVGDLARDLATSTPGSNVIRTLDAIASRTTTASRKIIPFYRSANRKEKIASFIENQSVYPEIPIAPMLLELATAGDGSRTQSTSATSRKRIHTSALALKASHRERMALKIETNVFKMPGDFGKDVYMK